MFNRGCGCSEDLSALEIIKRILSFSCVYSAFALKRISSVWEAKSIPLLCRWGPRIKVLRISSQRFTDKSPPCLSMLWGPFALGWRQQGYCAKTTAQSPPEGCSTNHIAPESCTPVSTLCPLGAEMFKGWDRHREQLLSRQVGSWLWWRLNRAHMKSDVHNNIEMLDKFTICIQSFKSFLQKISGCMFCYVSI